MRELLFIFVLLFTMGTIPTAQAATITVTTTADEINTNSRCSLREAIQAANTNKKVGACVAGSASGTDIISLPAGMFVLSHGDLDLLGKTRLVGKGSSTVIDGAAKDRVIDVKQGATITLQRLTVQNGRVLYPSDAAGIYNGGTLTLDRVLVQKNSTEGEGGGVYNAKGRSLTLAHSTIRDNYAELYGGGLTNYGAALLEASIVTRNQSAKGGGGIVNRPGVTITILSSTISSNTADDGSGGGLGNWGRATVVGSTFTGNRAFQGELYGGGIANLGEKLTIDQTTIRLNLGGVGGISGAATVKDSTMANNQKEPQYGTANDCNGPLTLRGDVTIGDPTGCVINE
jgi:CSLREA domain-containing protein